MKLSQLDLRTCSTCPNRSLCPEKDFRLLKLSDEKFSHRDFLYFPKGNYIFRKGEKANSVFCIYSGKAKVFKTDENNNEVILSSAADGDIIGFNSITEEHYVNSAIAIEDTFCCFFKLPEIEQLIKMKAPIAEKILPEHL